MRQLIPLLHCCLACLAAGMEQPNVLFIAADDLRVEPLALTPNLDRLAKRSRVFTNAHCQQAVCNPSRASLMTGLRPDTLRVWNLGTHFRETRPGVVTLPQQFRQRDNTLVVFWSDHGYHLGEHTLWAKTSNFELDTRVPLLISVPGMAAPGAAAAAPVELLDLFPTLVATCGLPAVAGLEGKALTPLLENPAATVKEAALSQFPRPSYYQGNPTIMGYSARSATHRYTEWRDWATGAVKARELYAHENDPRETRNLAGLPEHAGLIANLAAILPPAAPHPPPVVAAPPPPGIVIHHQPAASGLYIGSPSLCVLPDGSYLASHDLFGPKSNEYQLASGRIYRSADKGKTWRHLTDLRGFFWSNLFVHRGAAYAMGTDKHHGRLIIRRSVDAGQTWSAPSVLAEGQWHTAPVPVVEHGGRLWRAVEDAHTSPKWGERYRARMASVPAADDLLVAANWTISNPLARDAGWLGGDFAAWLEGNAVVAPDGGMVNILRVDNSRLPEKAAIVRISGDGTTATFDPASGFIEFPGGAKKFTIRKDPAGAGYWALASVVPAGSVPAGRPAAIRNTLALVFSKDLIAWETRCLLLRHPDIAKHGFQYVDWQFEGDDLIAVCRTAWDDEQGGARNHHDANYLTFHRWRNFRQLTRAEDAPLPEAGPGGK